MTKTGHDMALIRELASVKADLITDMQALGLHVRHITAAGHRPDSIEGRRGAIARLADYLDPHGENPRAVIDATSDQLAEWQADKADLSPVSIRKYIDHIQMYYRWLVSPMKIIPESVADELMKPIVRRRRPRPIAETDLHYALQVCVDPRRRAWLLLGSYAGLRSIDIAGLDRDDVLTEFEYPMLRVRGKGDNEDMIAIGHEVLAALEPFMHGPRGALFVTEDGRRVGRDRIRREMNAWLRAVGLPYTFHQARHRYGTHLYAITRDIRYTQKQLRHRSVASTEIYVDAPSEKDVQAVKALDAELVQRRRADLGA